MATQALRRQTCTPSPRCEPGQCLTVPIGPLYYPALRSSSHVFLDVPAHAPSPQPIKVTVFDGFSGKKVPLTLNSTDTVQGLKKMLKEQKPDLGDNPNLIYNGEPVEAQQTMAELGVKTGGAFMTFQRCVGG